MTMKGGVASQDFSAAIAVACEPAANVWSKVCVALKRELGDAFRAKLLSQGGSQDAITLFRSVVGHEPQIQPLLERRGLVVAPAAAASKPSTPAGEPKAPVKGTLKIAPKAASK